MVEHESTFRAYNSAVRALRAHCEDYRGSLERLVSGYCGIDEVEEHWCFNALDKHRLNICYTEMGGVLEEVRNNGELLDNRLVKIAMTHAYRHLGTVRSLCEDVSSRVHMACEQRVVSVEMVNAALFDAKL